MNFFCDSWFQFTYSVFCTWAVSGWWLSALTVASLLGYSIIITKFLHPTFSTIAHSSLICYGTDASYQDVPAPLNPKWLTSCQRMEDKQVVWQTNFRLVRFFSFHSWTDGSLETVVLELWLDSISLTVKNEWDTVQHLLLNFEWQTANLLPVGLFALQ